MKEKNLLNYVQLSFFENNFNFQFNVFHKQEKSEQINKISCSLFILKHIKTKLTRVEILYYKKEF
jgi:hypothetical protein